MRIYGFCYRTSAEHVVLSRGLALDPSYNASSPDARRLAGIGISRPRSDEVLNNLFRTSHARHSDKGRRLELGVLQSIITCGERPPNSPSPTHCLGYKCFGSNLFKIGPGSLVKGLADHGLTLSDVSPVADDFARRTQVAV